MTLEANTPEASHPGALLEIQSLTVEARGASRGRKLVDNVSLSAMPGEITALAGESGSGKTITALSVLRLLPRGAEMNGGRIRFQGEDTGAMPPGALSRLRGGRIGMLFQQPRAMLDPTCRIGEQIAEGLRKHRGMSRAAADAEAVSLLKEAGIADADERARCYAHEFSGGMAQRVMIACALSGNPRLLIADEPTSALDVTVQAQILELIAALCRKRGMAVLLITHDFAVIRAYAERLYVMYAGRIVESGAAADVLGAPRHPYTEALLRASLLEPGANGRLEAIPQGDIPAAELSGGCRFHPRCGLARSAGLLSRCEAEEPPLAASAGRAARCWAERGS